MATSVDFDPGVILSQAKTLIDVRSESEYLGGHIPGAVNIPILNDENRRLVGICYKQQGRDAAVRLGFRLAGPHFADMIARADQCAESPEVFVYCWRGGMRSSFFGWILSAAGFRVSIIKGGYKKFRSWALEITSSPPELLVIGGKTGSGKTRLIQILSKDWPVIDLELLAAHKGSAYGHLGMPAQPGNEQFENLIATWLWKLRDKSFLIVENESRMIGKVKLPDAFFGAMRSSIVLKLEIPIEERMQNILNEYGSFSTELLSSATARLERKLGGLRLRQALQALHLGNLHEWLGVVLDYYDENYEYSQSQRDPDKTFIFSGDFKSCQHQIQLFLEQKTLNIRHDKTS